MMDTVSINQLYWVVWSLISLGDYDGVEAPPVENPPAPEGGYGTYGDYGTYKRDAEAEKA